MCNYSIATFPVTFRVYSKFNNPRQAWYQVLPRPVSSSSVFTGVELCFAVSLTPQVKEELDQR